VYARELGTNIPRNKIYKQYRGADISLRSRDKEKDTQKDLSGKNTPLAAPIIVSAGESGASACTSVESLVLSQPSPDLAASTHHVAEASSPNAEAVSCDAAADRVESGAGDAASPTASTGDAAMQEEEEGGGEAELATATGSSSREFYLNPDETVFTGTMKYSELFTFWQVRRCYVPC
jgi:hypothetical protein